MTKDTAAEPTVQNDIIIDAQPASGEDEAPPIQAGDAPADAPKRKRRRRRRRGKGSGQDGEQGAAPMNGEAIDGDEDEDADDESPTVASTAPERAPRPATTGDQNDIFAAIPFDELGLRNSVMKGVRDAGFERSTYIQAKLIPAVLSGRDVLGQAKTGSGKTAAFGLPLFHMATRNLAFQSLILCPTRELAIQIAGELERLGRHTPIKVAAVYGGQGIPEQTRQLDRGPEIIVATPGRLMDMHQRRILHFDNVKFVVLDEVDRMLDIGFRDDIRKILRSVKSDHQTIFVSATISSEIEQLGRTFMRPDAEKIVAAAGSLTVSLVQQQYLPVQPWDKKRLLVHLLTHEEPALTVIFCRTKRTVDNLTKYLRDHKIDAHAIHGDMYQGKRNAVIKRLRDGELGVLVASDLAARGLDVEGISHVVNYDLPEDPEVYIHRIGRTARAGRGGVAWALVTSEQGHLLTAIEKLANVEIPKKDYPDFKPSGPPEGSRFAPGGGSSSGAGGADSGGSGAAAAAPPAQQSRYAAPPPPAPTPVGAKVKQLDASKFPMGIVPAKAPPRMMQGRVRTSRSAKAAATPPPPPADEA